jgi:hypothetical protein
MTKHGATRVASGCTEESAVAAASAANAAVADAAGVAAAGPSGFSLDRSVLARLVPASGLGSAVLAG